MRELSSQERETKSPITMRRTGLASVLFAILRSGNARAITVRANAVSLSFGSKSTEVSLGDVKGADLEAGGRWAGIRLRHATGKTTVSGLARNDAEAIVDALETARVDWWRRALAAQIGTLSSVHDRLTQFADPPKFVTGEVIRDLKCVAEVAAGGFVGHWPNTLSNAPEIQMLRRILEFLEAPDHARTKANEAFVANELARSRGFFDRIEDHALTEEQRRAVVVDEHRNLVVAAAGSGKTSVIVAKAGWLVSRGYRQPSELLLLAFAKDASKEMEERLGGRLGVDTARGLTVRTFHSLGLAIIGEAEGRRPTLARSAENDRALFDLLKGIVADLLTVGKVSAALLRWFQDWFAPYRNEHECKSWGEYWDYIRRYDIRSLKGEMVKSYEECEIANFLYLNGVAYEYEAAYEHNTATPERRQYQPDFCLTEAGIYIEHFGLDAGGKTAPFVDQDKYLEDMEWKRQTHAEHGTVLIETFSHERADGKLIDKLREKLAVHGVALSPIPRDEVFAVLDKQGRVDPFTRLLATFLQHFKGARLSFGEVSQQAASLRDRGRAKAFLAVFRPIFERYQETLSRSGEIDFHDMINRATDLVEAGKYRSPFGYILVDEFQDISPARARLLKALLKQSPTAQLFAVGDDWQAIFRFGGSDISVMREFEEHFGDSRRMDLETTFRCSDRIAAVATDFVLRNPAQNPQDGTFDALGGRTERSYRTPGGRKPLHVARGAGQDRRRRDRAPNRRRGRAQSQTGRIALGAVSAYATAEHGRTGKAVSWIEVLLQDSAPLEGARRRLCGGSRLVLRQIRFSRRDHRRSFARSGAGGAGRSSQCRGTAPALCRHHPCQATGLPACGRRTTLVFCQGTDRRGYDVIVFGRPPEGDVACPVCVEGRLERRENSRNGSIFYGCSNWPLCEHRHRACQGCGTGLPVKEDSGFRCRDCGQSIEPCPVCDGWLETRMGRYGRFLGCSNWPRCDHTRNLGRQRPRGQRRAQDATGDAGRRR